MIQYTEYRKDNKDTGTIYSEDEDTRKRWQHYQENEDFFALWAHQIKTPIAALTVLLQEEDLDIAASRQELLKIEGYVEMALGYTRYENMGNDLVLESQPLDQLVKNVVKKYSTMFIYKHLSVQLDHLEYHVLTDEKWFSFVLEQLLSNALKYTTQGGIHIYGEEDSDGLCVIVQDTGIGIRKEDLPRVFEKGFTGYNGRVDQKASGLGLYLCKGICTKLGHRLSIESELEKGTRVMIRLQQDRLLSTDLTKM
ncbi:MAG: ATP-binding protein [Lachnospiraceae bacterium]|nr:ATP-binding protein [Lachnospiraceae bacterium]